ncbi:transcriptional regulator [Bradyrhizobium sp. 31Argb]|uniref:transcriptional regulator n=1 Tax=unclassified Bradyrhizobium TaxID=2631580 RepID=UPI00102EAA7C|nr:transcriptional regulator [Bradyrhizobium sp. Leo170]TAI62863.1 transcriptional regulator [Bradyrhizobium sp. Leo170]
MAVQKPAEASPESIARANRQRLAMEEGARAMADVQQQAIAVRKNMERLRALREAREAEEATTQAARPDISNRKRKKVLSK